MSIERHTPKVGDYVKPDLWKFGENLLEGDDYVDSGFPGCQFRFLTWNHIHMALNIIVTGKKHWVSWGTDGARYRSRCKIEFVHDCEPSTFSGGWIYSD